MLEAQSGIDQTVISRLENGRQYGIRWSRFALLVDALGGLGPLPAREPWPGLPPSPPDRVTTPTRVVDLSASEDESDADWDEAV